MKRLLLALVAGALFLAACGDDDDGGVLSRGGGSEVPDLSAEEQEQADRVVASLRSDPGGPPLSDDEAECVGARIVTELGVERTKTIEWESSEMPALTTDDARGIARAMTDCADLRSMLAESIAEDGEITPDQAECFGQALSDDELVDILAFAFGSDMSQASDAELTPFADAALECLDFGAVLVEQFSADGNVSEASAKCLADALPEDLLRQAFVAGMRGEDTTGVETDFLRAILQAAPDCLTDEELQSFNR